MADSGTQDGAGGDVKITPELVEEIAELVYARLRREMRLDRERARYRRDHLPRRQGGK